MNSSNITVTDGRLMKAWNNVTQAIANNTSLSGRNPQKDNELHVGKLTRFFYETQEAEVKLTDKTVNCKLTRPTEGSVNIFFTPFAELEWDETLRKTYFKPYEDIRCVVAKINDKYYVISYFQNDKINTPPIASGGSLYLQGYTTSLQINGDNGGVYFNTPKIVYKDWMTPEQRNNVQTSDLTEENITNKDYYTKDEIYTKTEVDELIKELKEELGLKEGE